MPGPPSRFSNFLAELRHRRVFRVAAVYACVSFIIIQIIDGAFDYLRIPEWIGTTIIVLLALGFFIAVGMAWAFDLTDEGLVRTKPKREPTAAKAPHHIVIGNKSLAVIALLAIIVAAWSLLREPTPGGTAISSIAVLPFDNLSGDPEQVYFVEGIHEALISELSNIGAVTVISRRSTLQYKDSEKTMPTIASELGVDALVEGSAQLVGERVRITTQLIDSQDRHLWSNTYERKLEDVFALYNDVTRAIAQEIQAKLTPEEETRLASAPQVNPEAYNLYLKAWHLRNLETAESVLRAMKLLEQAVALDPTFALAWANLGVVYGLAWDWADLEWTEAVTKARYAVEMALTLNPNLAEAHVNRGLLLYYVDLPNVTTVAKWDEAGAAFQHALELNPGLLDAHYEYGLFLWRSARYDEAIPQFLKAQEISPFSFHAYNGLSWVYRSMGQFEQAYKYYLMQQDQEPSGTFFGDLPPSRLFMLYQQGRFEELLAAASVVDDPRMGLIGSMMAYRGLNEQVMATALFDSLRTDWQQRGVNKRHFPRLYAYYGDREGALTLLEEHFAELSLGQKRYYIANYHSDFGDLHGDPRYQALMAQTGLQY